MPADVARILEFDRVVEMLSRRCEFSVAAERALELGPSADPRQVAYLLAVTREAVALLSSHPSFGVGGMRDIRGLVERARIGYLLTPADLIEALDSIQASRSLRRAFAAIGSADAAYPEIGEFAGALADLPALEADLSRTVGPRGEILDSASEELARIRSELRGAHRRLLERLNRMIASGDLSSAIQDPIVTMREGRYVIPVRADRRSQVLGVVHGTSASGQTLFVEPLDVVELNNRWRELQSAEEFEIERVLRARTDQIAAVAEELNQTVEAAAAIDLALAKARLAFDLRAREPVMRGLDAEEEGSSPRRRIDLRQARHPLLDQRTVVPVDVRLGGEYSILVITGPNTGGKTVALKTVGLLAMMAQAGLFVPAADGSVLSVFSGIFADIGDEQSIEQSLSTFSSHMTRIVAMLRAADESSLVLLDEIAAGTDPEEGSALARAIIRALLKRGCLAIVTTHYSELKEFAYVTPGTENASVEFDVETLAPTYRLVTGVPGRSNALAIAARLGLPAEIIEDARAYLSPESERIEELLGEIQRRRAASEAALLEARVEREAAARLRRQAEQALRDAERERAAARQEALREVEAELREARAALRRLQAQAASATPARDRSRDETVRSFTDAEREIREALRRRGVTRAPAERFRVGDRVEVPAYGVEGEIVAISPGDEADVQAGSFKVRQPLSALRRLNAGGQEPPPRRTRQPLAPRVDQEIHLRGLRAAEAELEIDRYLDQALRASLPWVRVVHGKGTGALRKLVHDVLRTHPAVARFELAEPAAGGDGVTIVHLKS